MDYFVNIRHQGVLIMMPFYPEETFLASGIDVTNSGHHGGVALVVSVYYCRAAAAAQRFGWLLSDGVRQMRYINVWARSEAWFKHGIGCGEKRPPICQLNEIR